jgi:hypothetical protein
MPGSSERKCLIVLGMHRSGTSSLTGALHFTGFDIGKSIMPPADENPKGFFENTRIVDLNDKILEELFNFWSDTLFIPDGWWKSDLFEEHKRILIDILRGEFSGEKPVLLKDPRLCIVLPLYLDVFRQEGIEPVFLICVRNPLDIANSLKKRNNMPLEKSTLLWMDYQLKAELYSRDFPRLFISYSLFLQDPQKITEMVITLSGFDLRLDDRARKEIASFVDPELTHSSKENNVVGNDLLPELLLFYEMQANASLRDLSGDELANVDMLRTRFRALTRIYNGLPENYQASLTVLSGNTTKSVLTSPVSYGENSLNFDINLGIPVTRMVLRPCNARTGLVISKIELKLADGNIIIIDKFNSNASAKNARGLMLFDTDLPKVIIDLPHPENISKVRIQIFYYVFGIISCRKAFWRPAPTS